MLSDSPSTFGPPATSLVTTLRRLPSTLILHRPYPEGFGQQRVKMMYLPSGVNAGPSSIPVPSCGGVQTLCSPVPSAFTCQIFCLAMKMTDLPSGDQLAMKWSSHTLRG